MIGCSTSSSFFFFNDTATTEIYTLSLHDALPIWQRDGSRDLRAGLLGRAHDVGRGLVDQRVVEGLEANPDLASHWCLVGRLERWNVGRYFLPTVQPSNILSPISESS